MSCTEFPTSTYATVFGLLLHPVHHFGNLVLVLLHIASP